MGILWGRKIAVIGPQNTGKSTFVKDFVNAFPEFKTPLETYRDVVKKNNISNKSAHRDRVSATYSRLYLRTNQGL